MISAVAFCPHPPLLVPDVARGAAPELDDLRAACRTAIRRFAHPGARLVVVGAGAEWRQFGPTTRGSLAGYGVPVEIPLGSDEPGPVELPLALTIGAWLLRDALGADCGAIGHAVGPGDGRLPSVDDDVTLLVMGDGSARRSTSAPGYFDERAAAFDGAVVDALRSGDPARLRPDVALGDALLAAGSRAWSAAASLTAPHEWDADLLYDAAPYGVGYIVASWTQR